MHDATSISDTGSERAKHASNASGHTTGALAEPTDTETRGTSVDRLRPPQAICPQHVQRPPVLCRRIIWMCCMVVIVAVVGNHCHVANQPNLKPCPNAHCQHRHCRLRYRPRCRTPSPTPLCCSVRHHFLHWLTSQWRLEAVWGLLHLLRRIPASLWLRLRLPPELLATSRRRNIRFICRLVAFATDQLSTRADRAFRSCDGTPRLLVQHLG